LKSEYVQDEKSRGILLPDESEDIEERSTPKEKSHEVRRAQQVPRCALPTPVHTMEMSLSLVAGWALLKSKA
jgi:hypothetical protein